MSAEPPVDPLPTPTYEPPQRTVAARYHGATRVSTTHCVWHATAGSTAQSSLGWLNRPTAESDGSGVAGYTALIERDGTVFWHTPHDKRAYHAGTSAWPWPNGAQLNGRSVGIAFCNRQLPANHANFERITDAQLRSARWLVRYLAEFYPALGHRERHLRHRDCAPTRRADPTPATLDWNAFLDYLFAPDSEQ